MSKLGLSLTYNHLNVIHQLTIVLSYYFHKRMWSRGHMYMSLIFK